MNNDKSESKPENCAGKVPVEHLVMPHFRVVLLRVETHFIWKICCNPSWGHSEKCFSDVLLNQANEYVEYKNCGVQYRIIRFGDIDKYIDKLSTFKPEWALDPAKA